MKTEKLSGPNKILLALDRRTNTHREDCDHIDCIANGFTFWFKSISNLLSLFSLLFTNPSTSF